MAHARIQPSNGGGRGISIECEAHEPGQHESQLQHCREPETNKAMIWLPCGCSAEAVGSTVNLESLFLKVAQWSISILGKTFQDPEMAVSYSLRCLLLVLAIPHPVNLQTTEKTENSDFILYS